jgi:hypothetical protein
LRLHDLGICEKNLKSMLGPPISELECIDRTSEKRCCFGVAEFIPQDKLENLSIC